MPKNINLPKARVYIRKDAWGGSKKEFQEAWLVSVRSLRGRPLCFQVWVDEYSACFDKVRPDCLYWKMPKGDDVYSLTEVQMWECFTNDIELFLKAQLADVPCLVNMGEGEIVQGNYWFTIDSLAEKQGLGYLDVGDTEVLDEHKELNVIRLKNGQIAIYPNNRLKWIPESLSTEESIKKIPDWEVAQSIKWDIDWLEEPYELFGDSKFSY
tara:strand:+ start:3753 stop:4385 length:633 start_codon:yes stop_codon:yes gene_type:complete